MHSERQWRPDHVRSGYKYVIFLYFILINYSIIISTFTLHTSTLLLNGSRIPRGCPVLGAWLPVFFYARGSWTLASSHLCFFLLPPCPALPGQSFKFLGTLLRHVRSKILPTVAGLMLRLRRYPALNPQLHTQP